MRSSNQWARVLPVVVALWPSSARAQLWQKVQSTSAPPQIRALAIDSSGTFYVADRASGFYRSSDSGATWTPINAGIAESGGWTIDVNPSNGDLFAGTVGSSTTTGHFYRSTDHGASWTPIAGTATFNTPNYDGTVFATNGDIILGAFWTPYPDSGVWHSTDGGNIVVESPKQPVGAGGSTMGLGVNPVNGDIWMGSEAAGIFRSTDHGASFTQTMPATNPSAFGNLRGIAFDAAGNVLVGSTGGIWKSTNPTGLTWNNVLHNGNTSAGRKIVSDANGALYYGHRQDANNPATVYRSTDGGNTWTAWNSGTPDGLEASDFDVNPCDGKLYANLENGSTDAGVLYVTTSAVQAASCSSGTSASSSEASGGAQGSSSSSAGSAGAAGSTTTGSAQGGGALGPGSMSGNATASGVGGGIGASAQENVDGSSASSGCGCTMGGMPIRGAFPGLGLALGVAVRRRARSRAALFQQKMRKGVRN